MAFYITNCRKISADFFLKSTVIFPEISAKILQEIFQLTTLVARPRLLREPWYGKQLTRGIRGTFCPFPSKGGSC